MPYSKNSYTSFNSDPDESLYYLMNSSLGSCQGYSYEAIMIQEALATTTQPRDEQNASSNKIIKFEIAVSLILIVVTLLIGVAPEPDLADTSTDIHNASQHEQILP